MRPSPARIQNCLFAAAAAWLLGIGVARAETFVLLPTQGHADVSAKAHAESALTAALVAQRIKVVDRKELARRVADPSLRTCETGVCIASLLKATDASFAIGVAVWSDASIKGSTEAHDIVVGLVDADGERFDGKAVVEHGDLPRATREALRKALAKRAVGFGPWLRVNGAPAGSTLWIDGKKVGLVPWRGRVDSGGHELRLEHIGYASGLRTVSIPADPSLETTLDVTLSSLRARSTQRSSRSATTHPIVGPVLLGVAGAASVAVGIYGLAASDSCDVMGASGRCLEGHEGNVATAAVYTGVGVGAIAGAVLWYVLGAKRQESKSLRATVGPTQVSLSGRF